MPRPSSHKKNPETLYPLQPAWTARQFHLLASLNGTFWEHAQPCYINAVTATFVATPEFRKNRVERDEDQPQWLKHHPEAFHFYLSFIRHGHLKSSATGVTDMGQRKQECSIFLPLCP
jgi:hypothetical protein